MYLQKVISKTICFLVGVLKVTEEKSRIRLSKGRIRRPRSVPTCHVTGTQKYGSTETSDLNPDSIMSLGRNPDPHPERPKMAPKNGKLRNLNVLNFKFFSEGL
jgi:hypothetical protein